MAFNRKWGIREKEDFIDLKLFNASPTGGIEERTCGIISLHFISENLNLVSERKALDTKGRDVAWQIVIHP